MRHPLSRPEQLLNDTRGELYAARGALEGFEDIELGGTGECLPLVHKVEVLASNGLNASERPAGGAGGLGPVGKRGRRDLETVRMCEGGTRGTRCSRFLKRANGESDE